MFVVIVVIGIFIISYTRLGNSWTEKEALCIANKTKLYVSTGCHICRSQEEILGKNIKYFDVTNCAIQPESCSQNGILRVPAWIINEQEYRGAKSIAELKQLTGC